MNKDVKYLTPKRSVKEIHGTERRAASAQAVAELMFVKAAQEQQLDETTIAEYPDLFVEWDANWRGKQGDIVQDEGNLYRSIHDVTNEGQNTKPSATPSMWTRIGNPLDEFPEWVQPIGAHDAYAKGDKASHNGKNWVSTADNNVWEPGVYGWEEASSTITIRWMRFEIVMDSCAFFEFHQKSIIGYHNHLGTKTGYKVGYFARGEYSARASETAIAAVSALPSTAWLYQP